MRKRSRHVRSLGVPGGASGRRAFLQALSCGALLVIGLGLPGCGAAPAGGGPPAVGGGTADGGTGGNGGNLATLTGEQVAASLAAVDDYMDSLTPASADELRASLLEFMSGRTDFINAGLTDDGVWGTLANGGTYLILTNRAPQPGEESLADGASALAVGTDVPKGSLKALLVNAMGSAFSNEAAALRPAPNARGYQAVTGTGSLDSLKSLGDPAFFYISAHGGVCPIPQLDANGRMVRGPDGKVVMVNDFSVSTSTEATPAAIQARMPDFEAGRIVAARMVEDLAGGAYVRKTMFCITSRWVTQYWHFADDSLVWVSACSGMSAGAAPFIAACKAKGAGLYVGWTDSVSGPAALGAARFAVDRLTGANVLSPKEDPPQRSFDYQKVWADMGSRGLDQSQVTDSVTGAPLAGRITQLKYSPKAATSFGLLAPSIHHLLVDEAHDKVHLYGIFGKPAETDRAVLIDGVEATVDSWDEGEIVCPLPRNGQGSKGEVKVFVRGHESNVRRITEWNFDLTYTYDNKDEPGLRIDGHYLMRFRGDIGEYREAPHQTPKKPLRCLVASLDSVASLTASGTHYEQGGGKIEWSGSADFPAESWQGAGAERILVAVLKVDTEARKGALGLALGAMAPAVFTQVYTPKDDPPVTTKFAPFQSILEEEDEFPIEFPGGVTHALPLLAMFFSYGGNFGVPAHKFIDVDLGELTMEWPAAAATYPPDDAAARQVD